MECLFLFMVSVITINCRLNALGVYFKNGFYPGRKFGRGVNKRSLDFNVFDMVCIIWSQKKLQIKIPI